jgi:hypothetical protein
VLVSRTICKSRSPIFVTTLMILRISSVSDAVWSKFVKILNDSQGDLLRQFSVAVLPMINTLLIGSPQHRELSKLESFQVSDIMQCPKGSPGLLSLLC